MKGFHFQFASILQLRKTREDEAMRALGRAQEELKTANAERDALMEKLERSFARRERLGEKLETSLSFKLEQDFITGQKSRIERQLRIVVKAQRSVEKSFRTFLDARKKTEMMERLKEKHYAEYRRRRAQKEEKELDDLSIMRTPFLAAERAEDEETDIELNKVMDAALSRTPTEDVA